MGGAAARLTEEQRERRSTWAPRAGPVPLGSMEVREESAAKKKNHEGNVAGREKAGGPAPPPQEGASFRR